MEKIAICLLAGGLSTLSPCVLPVLPLVVAAAFQQHRLGPLVLAAGMTLSFTIIGVAISSVGHLAGIGQEMLRSVAAVVLVSFGLIMLSERLQTAFARLLAPLASRAERRIQSLGVNGLGGQLVVGLLLGIVWTPCSGPALGTAMTLAAQEGGIIHSTFMMLSFGIGASLPVLLVAYSSRQAFSAARGGLAQIGSVAKKALGLAVAAVGLVVLLGADKLIESFFVEMMPDWLIDISTRY